MNENRRNIKFENIIEYNAIHVKYIKLRIANYIKRQRYEILQGQF
jgi:hypothetical protein